MPELTFENEIKNRLQRVYSFSEDEATEIISSIDEEKILRLFSVLRSEIINESERQNAKIWGPYWLYDYFAIEAISKLHSADHMKSMFTDYLPESDKIVLLMGFKFSDAYLWGEGTLLADHLMRRDMMADEKFVDEYYVKQYDPNEHCIAGICLCDDWIRSRQLVDEYLKQLQTKLKDMRDSIVHESSQLAILPDYSSRGEAAYFSSSVLDSYRRLKENRYNTYECSINPDVYFRITMNCRREFLASNYLRA